MGKVTRVRKKLVGSAVFLKLVLPLVFSDPACAENRVGDRLLTVFPPPRYKKNGPVGKKTRFYKKERERGEGVRERERESAEAVCT